MAGEAADSAESGRGLFLVECVSDSWGWHPSPAPAGEFPSAPLHGKVVWALFRLTDCAKNGQ
ncbi:non-specific serine/threonine protein kinase OS=Streptomyces microflavus OX=1919 GN=Smic_34580 PE=3 SV=1 [Streptomyces microflavus]